jgi:hypothetical protein
MIIVPLRTFPDVFSADVPGHKVTRIIIAADRAEFKIIEERQFQRWPCRSMTRQRRRGVA